MKKSGCYFVAFGIESGNQKILEKIKKGEDLETIKKAIEMVDKLGLICQGFFIFGLPGETKRTIIDSIEFAKKSKLSRAQFAILDILPGSELWESLKGKFKPNWNKISYLEPEWVPEGITKLNL
ncbi:MAG: radical SAM protein [bacterium]|nr:radical SAM protein [bacterium]